MGRLFDAVAALAGVRAQLSYEGQAAMELEWLATEKSSGDAYPWEVLEVNDSIEALSPDKGVGKCVIDTRPLIRAVAADSIANTPAAMIARRFHSTVVDMIANICWRIHQKYQLQKVIFSGGVFMNALLTKEADARLSENGFSVFHHRRVPANDGGLSLGQLAVASRLVASTTPK